MRKYITVLFPLLLVLGSCTKISRERSSDLDGNPAQAEDVVTPANKTLEPKNPTRDAVTTCGYENNASSLGIGLVLAPQVFTLWSDSATTEEYLSVSTNTEEGIYDICPQFYKPDYGILQFVCLASDPNTYTVLADSTTVKYIRKSTDGIVFKYWNEYILESFGIRRKRADELTNKSSHLLRAAPAESAPSIDVPSGHEMFCPMEVQNDWVKVRYDCFYNREQNPHEGEPCHNFIDQCENPVTGWLKWRDGNELLIDIFLMP